MQKLRKIGRPVRIPLQPPVSIGDEEAGPMPFCYMEVGRQIDERGEISEYREVSPEYCEWEKQHPKRA
jgi:hypothetical protein